MPKTYADVFINTLDSEIQSTALNCKLLFDTKHLPVFGNLPIFKKLSYEKRWYVVMVSDISYTVFVDYSIKIGPLRLTWHKHILKFE